MVVSWAIPHCLGVPAQFLGYVTLGTRFKGDTKNSSFFAFYGHFVGYSTLFRGPGAISMPRDSQYTVEGATLKTRCFRVLWPFRGLFHTVLGFRCNFYAT